MTDYTPDQVLNLWFPDDGHWEDPERHGAFWNTRMQGGMDEVICRNFAGLTEAAAKCELDHWAETARGRLALLIALDQFPRSLWRDTPAAYAQDIKACRLALEGIDNGDFAALALYERQFFIISISHCEGPDHLDRMDLPVALGEEMETELPNALESFRGMALGQSLRVRDIIARFGRHPHRNAILGRPSSAAEEAYIATGDFPHVRKVEDL